MIDKFELFSLTALVVTAGPTSAQAHAVDGVGAARGDGFARRVAANVEFAHGVVASGERGVKGGVEIDLVSENGG